MQYTFTTPGGSVPGLYRDALTQPHMLIAGATGSGKSVVINGMVFCALHRLPFDRPDGVQFILIDPKRVELAAYKDLPHTIRYASEPETIVSALNQAMQICEDRYRRMQRERIRKYNGADLYVIIDEFADLMTTNRRVIQPIIQRLAQIGRAARVHIVLATQTPISKVLPTEIKCNFDARIGLRTRSAQDSRNIIGSAGLEDLPRYGQGYYMRPEGEAYYTMPMIPDADLSWIVSFWLDQYRRQQPKRRGLFCRRSA